MLFYWSLLAKGDDPCGTSAVVLFRLLRGCADFSIVVGLWAPLFFVGCVVDVTIAAGCNRFRCRVPGDGCLFCSLTGMCCICERFGGSWSE